MLRRSPVSSPGPALADDAIEDGVELGHGASVAEVERRRHERRDRNERAHLRHRAVHGHGDGLADLVGVGHHLGVEERLTDDL